ncbi:3-isopropylmalate dehydratase large subunit [Actinomadura chibensis]|uniref:3-isopropylmalate dehydratase large subunit n=1 Tax=Actinomadura chibensis TaxID=392828 RepID=A0A5D0NT79_9ACTN|nr:3-isopropylmalate dehydratase large subunit [Actinomadura chibensis]
MGMTIAEKILARHSAHDVLAPGDLAVVEVDTAVPLDLNFYPEAWSEPVSVFDPDKVVVIFDHIVPAPNHRVAESLERGRAFVERLGITRFHDVGARQGICHQVIADVPYARPGEILVCCDSHTCSSGAFNCAARGIGTPELIYVLAKGRTWFQVGPTIRYDLLGELRDGVTTKDLFLHIAGTYGDHVGCNVEFGGPGLASLTIDQRRTLCTMCAEISAEFAIMEPDEVLAAYMAERGVGMDNAVWPDADAVYQDSRAIDLSAIQPMVGLPDSVVGNTAPVASVEGVPITRAFVGSCSNGTLEDLREVAAVLAGRRVHPGVQLLVTPGSQEIHRRALAEGIVATLIDAGALITTSSCGMCAGFVNALSAKDVCIASSTRNFKGRMGHPDARIHLASSRTVALSALAGHITAGTRRPQDAEVTPA